MTPDQIGKLQINPTAKYVGTIMHTMRVFTVRGLSEITGLTLRTVQRAKADFEDAVAALNGNVISDALENEKRQICRDARDTDDASVATRATSVTQNDTSDASSVTSVPRVCARLESPSGIVITQGIETNKQTVREVESSLVGSCALKQAFNGSTDNLIKSVMAWMNCPEQNARTWLQSMLSLHGQEPVLRAYADLIAKQAQGEIVASPIRYWSGAAANMKTNPKSAGPAPKPMTAKQQNDQRFRDAYNARVAASKGAVQ